MQTEVIVLGGGSAGIAAAVSARRAGAETTLIERHTFLGGMATAAMVGTFCGLYYRDPNEAQVATPGFPIEFATAVSEAAPHRFAENLWFLSYHPERFKTVAEQVVRDHGASLQLDTAVQAIEKTGDGFRVCVANQHIDAPTLIDCSGFAFASDALNLPVLDTQDYQAGAIVFGVDGLPGLSTEVLRLTLIREIQRGVNDEAISPELLRVSVVPGSHQGCSALLKLGMPARFADDEDAYEQLAREQETACIAFLKTCFPELHQTVHATQVGIRSSRRPRGDAILCEAGVLACSKPEDGIAIGAWPIEYWGDAMKPEMVYFDAHDHYTIPAGCLQTAACPGLFFAGRNISADERALASARVMGTCLGTGYAAGELAAKHASSS